MSTLLLILIILAALIALVLIGAASLKNEYVIDEEITIDRPTATVFDFIKLVRNQERFNKWVMIDPQSKKEYKGTDGTVGFVYYWDSSNKQVGKGEQEISGVREGERIDFEIRFIRPFEGKMQAFMSTTAVGNQQTRVNWIIRGNRNFAMKIMHFLLNLKKMLAKDLQTSLQNLKKELEKA